MSQEDAAGGTLRQWEAHYERWSDRVFRYVVHLVGPGENAEDLFQETWMKALHSRRQLSSHDKFGPWILRIARNLAFNRMRTKNRRARIALFGSFIGPDDEPQEDFGETRPSNDPSPLDRAIRTQRRAIVLQAIGRLDEQTQEMLQLRYFEELTLAEIAETLDVPLGTVCTKVHRGLKNVRKHLQRQGYNGLDEI